MPGYFIIFILYIFKGDNNLLYVHINNLEVCIHVQIEDNNSYNTPKIEISDVPIDWRLDT